MFIEKYDEGIWKLQFLLLVVHKKRKGEEEKIVPSRKVKTIRGGMNFARLSVLVFGGAVGYVGMRRGGVGGKRVGNRAGGMESLKRRAKIFVLNA